MHVHMELSKFACKWEMFLTSMKRIFPARRFAGKLKQLSSGVPRLGRRREILEDRIVPATFRYLGLGA